jgi:hypothetical protein
MIAEAALYQLFVQQLTGLYPVYGDLAPATATMPYIVFSIQSGGETNTRGDKDDADFMVQVSCYAETSPVAYAGALHIQQRLNDTGTRDRNALPVSVAGWTITTMTKREAISLLEPYLNTAWIYRRGAIYEVIMEAT